MPKSININDLDFTKLNFKGVGIVPVVVQDHVTKRVRMLGFMNKEAFEKTLSENRVTFYSRTDEKLWTKGEESGNFLHVNQIALDCDNDTLLITVKADGPTCHTGSASCFDGTQELLRLDNGKENGSCTASASLLPYCNDYFHGYVILQKNEKSMEKGGAPFLAEAGGKVNVSDKELIDTEAVRSGLEYKVIAILRQQFAGKDNLLATFAFAALREFCEEMCGEDTKFVYSSIVTGKAILRHIDRKEFGLKPADWTRNRHEAFYLDFGSLPVHKLMENFQASGNRDCRELVAVKIDNIRTIPLIVGGRPVPNYNGIKIGDSDSLVKVCQHLEQQRTMIVKAQQLARENRTLLFAFGTGAMLGFGLGALACAYSQSSRLEYKP